MTDRSVESQLPEGDPLPRGRAPLLHRLLSRPWPLIDVLVLGTRTCPLCELARRDLGGMAAQLGLRVRYAGIDAEPALLDRFRDEVPVIFVAGKKHAIGRVDPNLLRRQVRALRHRSP